MKNECSEKIIQCNKILKNVRYLKVSILLVEFCLENIFVVLIYFEISKKGLRRYHTRFQFHHLHCGHLVYFKK